MAKALTTLLLFWSSGGRFSSGVPHLNNSDSILFCLGAGLSSWLNHVLPKPVCGNPFSLYLFSSMVLRVEQHQRETGVRAP